MRVTVTGKGITPDCKKDSAFWVRNYEAMHEATAPIKVGDLQGIHVSRGSPSKDLGVVRRVCLSAETDAILPRYR